MRFYYPVKREWLNQSLYSPSLPLSHSGNSPTVTDELPLRFCSNAPLKSLTTSSILKASSAGRLFEQKFYGLFEHMSLAFESTSLQRQRSFHAQSIADGSIVITFTLGLTLKILQAQSVRSWLISVHYSRGKSARYTTAGSIVATIAVRSVATIVQPRSCLIMAWYVLPGNLPLS